MRKRDWIIIVILLLVAGGLVYSVMDTSEQATEPPGGEEQTNEGDGKKEEGKEAGDDKHPSYQHMEYNAKIAPKFSADDLNAFPSGNWLTNGGDLRNDRYSPLEQITTANVKDLKADWVTSLGSGFDFKYSGEATPLVYDGVMFMTTGANEVAALDATTGEIIWEYKPKLAEGLDTVCCGWLSRGVALGDGKVYTPILDGRLVALDQKNGKVVWETTVGEWEKGYTTTSAPLYFDGKVYQGVAGGEYGIRGYLAAYDAENGEEIWKTHTVAGPDETGGDSWADETWKTGGAPIWQTPALDPELGMVYVATGNASPDLDGSNREGDNLFSDSVLALDANTGEYKWHFQEVHHDIWDMDAANPVVLFDVEIDGKPRKGIVQAGKTGWLYILDRTNGEPLIGIEEKPVPQLKDQKTSPTQPHPVGDAFVPQNITEEDVKRDLSSDFSGKFGPIFTPFWDEPTVIKPSPQGGANWAPSAYNPDTELFYVLGNDNYFAFAHHEGDKANEYEEGREFIGSVWQPVEKAPNRSTITAMDIKTNKIVWQKNWDTIAYSGALTTKGNLLFVGHNDGRLIAFDATTGDQVWEFMTDAGANAPAMTYEVDGKQYISVFSAGNSLAGTTHGDKIYTFSLEGKFASLEDIPEDAVNISPVANDHETDDQKGHHADEELGLKTYENNCLACHGEGGSGGHNGPVLKALEMDREAIINQIKKGGGGMPGFEGTLTEDEINAVTDYIESLNGD